MDFETKILEFFLNKGYPEIQIIKDDVNHQWKVECKRPIKGCEYNNWANTKYEDYNVKLYNKHCYKSHIKNVISDKIYFNEPED